MKRLILASASPRRRALMSALGLEFEVITSAVEELSGGAPHHELVMKNAKAKRDDVASRTNHGALVIAADTLVFLGDQVLSKPVDLDEARDMLSMLSGNTHEVITGIALVDQEKDARVEGYERTLVTFRELTRGEIDHFVHAVRPTDRAGAYTVDGPGSLLVASYAGCYQNVLGLPIIRLDILMRELGYNLFELMDHTQAEFL